MLDTQTSTSISWTIPSNIAGANKAAQTNLLVLVATPLLTLMTQLRHTKEHPNIAKLRNQIIEEIKHFEQQLVNLSYPMRFIIAARYCLCTAFDEAVLSQTWGTQGVWIQQSLLSIFHKETWGGERFYIIVEDMAKNPAQNLDFLELSYILLSLGFEGKYFGNQLAIREEIRNRIFYRIRYSKEKPDKTLSNHAIDKNPIIQQSRKNYRLKRLLIITACLLTMMSLFYNIKLATRSAAMIKSLQSIGNVSPITTFSQVIQRPIIERGMT